ncbi:MAG TPA: hypothetical protein PLV68_02890, partial [Ilumatobacteraceae bacterium]|nr:hypothetical protein [Ilumatobacteraceae bacterium]
MSLHNDGLAGGPPKFYAILATPGGTLVAGSCVRGLSRSIDGGIGWEPVDGLDHVSINTLVCAPDSSILAATSGGLWRSIDEARSWQQIDDRPRYAVLPGGVQPLPDQVVFRLLALRDGRTIAGTDGAGVWVTGGSS